MRIPALKSPRYLVSGFTLIEILIVIGLIAILAAVVLVAVNPARQFAQARNSQRVSNVNAILNAVGARIADNRGEFATENCLDLPSSTITISNLSNQYDLRPCLVPTYIAELPTDPETGSNSCITEACSTEGEVYETGYTIARAVNGRVTVCSPQYTEEVLDIDKQYCLSR